jgi:hypothetical protein
MQFDIFREVRSALQLPDFVRSIVCVRFGGAAR